MWESDGGVRRRGQDLGRHRAPEVRDLLGPLVDEQHDEVHLGVVLRDGLPQVLEERRLPRLGRRDDQAALAAPDGRDQVDDAKADLRLLGGRAGRPRAD